MANNPNQGGQQSRNSVMPSSPPPATTSVASPNGWAFCYSKSSLGSASNCGSSRPEISVLHGRLVQQLIEPELEPIFLADSYGYRPRKSALDAVGVTRKRCWKYDWVPEFDIKGLFDNIDHELLLRAVRKRPAPDIT
jgi:hypothetical protein